VPGEGLVYVLVPCSAVPLCERNVQVVRICQWRKWLSAGVMCDVQWYLHVVAYYPYSSVLQFAPCYTFSYNRGM